jgi:DNA-binding NarL/FixJ family response regulator
MFDELRPVLIIDDCPMYRTALRGMLIKIGFNPKQVLQGKNAALSLIVAELHPLQLVFCDYNLGKDTNGHQLLDELYHRNILLADCVVIIITGDSSTGVVRDFAELSPDGYLVKPLNYLTLKERLPKLAYRKRTLSDLLNTYANGDFKKTVDQADKSVLQTIEILQGAQFLKAKALLKLNKIEDARNLLSMIKDGPERLSAILELARIAMLQHQYSLCQSLLQPLEIDPIHGAAALELSAENYLKQKHLPMALKTMTKCVEKFSKNTKYHLLKIHIAMALFDTKIAYDSVEIALNQSRDSFRETLLLHHLSAQLNLDVAQFSNKKIKDKLLMRFAKQCRDWRRSFSRKDYKAFELLLQARAQGIKGNISRTRELLDEYHLWFDKNYEPSIYEKLELYKIYYMLDKPDCYQLAEDKIKQAFSGKEDSWEKQTILLYIAHWQKRMEQKIVRNTNLKRICSAHMDAGNYDKALSSLVKAMNFNCDDVDISRLILICLSKAWPIGWNKKEVSILALRCRDLLKNTSIKYTFEYKQAVSIIASQLSNDKNIT